MPANRQFHANQQSEFATIAGGNFQGGPNVRNNPTQPFNQQQGHYVDQTQSQHIYNGMQQPVRGGAKMPAPPTNHDGGIQEVQKPAQQSKPVIRSKEELSKLFCTIRYM